MTEARAGGSRVRTVFLGSGSFGRESLWRLEDHPDVRLVGVVTAPPRPAGRKQALTPSVIDDAAGHLGLRTVLRPERLRASDSIAAVLALEPELLVLADYGQIVPASLLELRHGALNLHPSLLPRHRGATPIPAAILAGDTETGVTLMRMDEGLDTGPIIAQERVALEGVETAPWLESKLEVVADHLLDVSLGPWIRGELEPRPQPEDGATVTRPLRRADGRLDPSRTAVDLWRQVRAYQPWPGSFVDTTQGRIVMLKTSVGPASDRPAGTFGSRGLAAADRELLLHEVQPAGGKPMPWEAYLRGHPGINGSAALASDA
jgi:methionyl-tRNA formyltransferase